MRPSPAPAPPVPSPWAAEELTLELVLRARQPGAVRLGVSDLDGHMPDGRRVILFQVDPKDRQGALSAEDSEAIAAAAHTARTYRRPLVGVVGSSGADILAGMPALHGWGQAARAIADCSGIVPVVLIVHGPAVSGPALLLGLADIVIMTAGSYAFVSGPTMVAGYTGLHVDNDTLGGPEMHARTSGLATRTVADVPAAIAAVAKTIVRR